MNKPTFRSRTVNEDGWFQIDFTELGIFLTKITDEEVNQLPYSHRVYMLRNQYLEGEDYLNYHKRMDVGGLQYELNIYTPNTTNTHECKYTRYIGLTESFNYCSECGAKQ